MAQLQPWTLAVLSLTGAQMEGGLAGRLCGTHSASTDKSGFLDGQQMEQTEAGSGQGV